MSMFNFVGRLGIGSTFCSFFFLSLFFLRNNFIWNPIVCFVCGVGAY